MLESKNGVKKFPQRYCCLHLRFTSRLFLTSRSTNSYFTYNKIIYLHIFCIYRLLVYNTGYHVTKGNFVGYIWKYNSEIYFTQYFSSSLQLIILSSSPKLIDLPLPLQGRIPQSCLGWGEM